MAIILTLTHVPALLKAFINNIVRYLTFAPGASLHRAAWNDDEEAKANFLSPRHRIAKPKGPGKLGLLNIRIPPKTPFVAQVQRCKEYVKREQTLRRAEFERHVNCSAKLPSPTRSEVADLLISTFSPFRGTPYKSLLTSSSIYSDRSSLAVPQDQHQPDALINNKAAKKPKGKGRLGLLTITIPRRSPIIGVKWQNRWTKTKHKTSKSEKEPVGRPDQIKEEADIWLEIYSEDAKARAVGAA